MPCCVHTAMDSGKNPGENTGVVGLAGELVLIAVRHYQYPDEFKNPDLSKIKMIVYMVHLRKRHVTENKPQTSRQRGSRIMKPQTKVATCNGSFLYSYFFWGIQSF